MSSLTRKDVLIIMAGIIAIGIMVIGVIASIIVIAWDFFLETNAQMQVMERITNNSTDIEIINSIQEVCQEVYFDTPWYIRSYCESNLFDTFIGDINEH